MESATTDSGENVKIVSKDELKSQSDRVINGLSNGISSQSDGHHKHKHKDKDKEKDRHHDKHRNKDKDRDKERDKHSSSKDKSRDDGDRKHKDERKDKDHHRDRDKEHRDKNKDRDKEHRSKDKDSRDKVKESSEKNKENCDREHKDKHRESNEKSKHRDHSQNSKSKDHRSSSSSKSEYHSSSKDKEKSRSSSSSSKEKHSSNKHKDKHSSDKHNSKHSSGEKKLEPPSKTEKQTEKERKNTDSVKIKEEPVDSVLSSQPAASEVNNAIKSEPLSPRTDADESCASYQNGNSLESSIKSEPELMVSIKPEAESEEDIPLSLRKSASTKRKNVNSESEDDVPLSTRKKIKKESALKKRKKTPPSEEDDYESDVEKKKKKNKVKKEVKPDPKQTESPTKRKKKDDEEDQNIWKWWEEEKKDDGVKWTYLEHKGPMFAPPYEPLPKSVKFSYNGKEMRLSQDAEEVATFYARMIEHEYTSKDIFNKNFFKDWRKTMTNDEREIITDLKKCNFRSMYEYFVQKSEERKAMSKEEKKKIKEQNDEITKEYGICVIDGHKEKIGNFRIEPPGLFRGRGEHPKMGMLKRRVTPEDVIINCSKDSKKPVPPDGHKWKEVRHDNAVTWLASWTENVQGQVKYVMLNPSSKLKGEKDWQKYETARKLAKCVDKIRQDYREDWKSKEMRIRQRAVAMYFIDKLALRAGNEKDEDQADTVGCCSLRVEHIQLHEEKDGKEFVVVFDFLGKDSIRYYNEVPVEKRVFKNLQLFCEQKKGSDDLFDRLNTGVLNKHLNELMEGLTAKVFRTYNASITLQNQLNELTDPNASIPEKILQYNRANRAVAILCNHQRSVPKSHEKSMGNLKQKIDAKREQVGEAQKQYKEAKRDAKDGSSHSKMVLDKKKKALERLKEQLMKLEVQETDKEENKTIALGTSKLNYLDPRISVAWCKKYGVPIEKVYNKTQRSKFRWAIDMAGPDFVF